MEETLTTTTTFQIGDHRITVGVITTIIIMGLLIMHSTTVIRFTDITMDLVMVMVMVMVMADIMDITGTMETTFSQTMTITLGHQVKIIITVIGENKTLVLHQITQLCILKL